MFHVHLCDLHPTPKPMPYALSPVCMDPRGGQLGPGLSLPPPARRCPCSLRGTSLPDASPHSLGTTPIRPVAGQVWGSVSPGGAWFARGHRQELIVLLWVRGGKSSERQPRGRGVLDPAGGGGSRPCSRREGSSSSSVQAGLCAVPPSTRLLGAQVPNQPCISSAART